MQNIKYNKYNILFHALYWMYLIYSTVAIYYAMNSISRGC